MKAIQLLFTFIKHKKVKITVSVKVRQLTPVDKLPLSLKLLTERMVETSD